MFKTIFIIFVSMIVSTLTTAGLLLRYTAPAATPAVTVATVKPIEIAYTSDPEPVAVIPVINTDAAVSIAPETQPQPETVAIEVSTAQQSRSFNHQLLVSDITSLSQKLARFNEFLSGEVQRLKDSKDKKQP